MPDLLERAILTDQLMTSDLFDEDVPLTDENIDPPLTCWITCENPLCFTHGCRNSPNNKGKQS